MTTSALTSDDLVLVQSPAPHVTELVLNRPAALNALSSALASAVVEAAATVATDVSVRAVVLSSSSPRAFCVGADLKERASFTDEDLLAQRPLFRSLFAAIRDLPMPTVAAVTGPAVGGGFELALSCDLLVVEESAVVGLPEVGVGLVPGGGGTQLVARRAGYGRAADLLFTARRLSGTEAASFGLVDRLVAPGGAAAAALELASQIAAKSPVAVRGAKRALGAALDLPLTDGLLVEDAAWRTAATSVDRHEGIRAFVEKREPRWSGR